MKTSRDDSFRRDVLKQGELPPHHNVLSQESFGPALRRERLRTERSGKPFVLVLLDVSVLAADGEHEESLNDILLRLRQWIRDSDIVGWYEESMTVGAIFTEIDAIPTHAVASALLDRFNNVLSSTCSVDQVSRLRLSLQVFPTEWKEKGDRGSSISALYASRAGERARSKLDLRTKRAIDIIGSSAALIMLAPLMAAISIAVKLTSEGPILFRQQRVGRDARCFQMMKFRSMRVDNDQRLHEEFVSRLISDRSGQSELSQDPSDGARAQKNFKIVNDPRVTPIGRFLRRTSLDELPQFMNVLRGEMSLVGPRPAVPYEVNKYDTWHRRRFMDATPGITGLWQVTARSRVGFAEMVRLDLQYSRSWSLWLDIKILLQTPRAVMKGDGT